MGFKHHVLSTVREDNSSPERPVTPTNSSPPSANRSSLRRSQSHSQLDSRQPSMLSRGSSPSLAALNVQPDLAQSSGREDTRRKNPAASWQVLLPPVFVGNLQYLSAEVIVCKTDKQLTAVSRLSCSTQLLKL